MAKEPQDEFYLRLKEYIQTCNDNDLKLYGVEQKHKWFTHIIHHPQFIESIISKLGIVGIQEAIPKILEIDRKKRLVFQWNSELDIDPEARKKGTAKAREELGYENYNSTVPRNEASISKGIKGQEEAKNAQNGKLEGNTGKVESRLSHVEKMELIKQAVGDKIRL